MGDPEKRYVSTSPCKRGHVGERYRANSECVTCCAERAKAAHARHKDKRNTKKRAKYANDLTHREHVSRRNRAYREKVGDCDNAKKRERWANDAEWRERHLASAAERRRRADPEAVRAYFRQWRYGLSPEDFEAMHRRQGGRCAICASEGQLVVDHCHTTEAIRGLLCNKCNTALGLFRDDPANLIAAAAYLRGPP